jgi:hypothetical protein
VNDELLLETLSALEALEAPLLSWGITTGSFGEQEVLDAIQQAVPTELPDDVLDALIDRGLILSKGLTSPTYRTRMAETVRLAVNLRQWFHGRDWRTAPTLVSDLRFVSRTRSIPRRDRTPQQASDDLSAALGPAWTQSHSDALARILDGRAIAEFQHRSAQRLLMPQSTSRGTVVTAGTGAGKTLAFYLPVLTQLLATPRRTSSPRIIAIYPRTELLRDQLRSLLEQTRRLEGGSVGLSTGVLYGATPYNRADAVRQARRGWRRRGQGLVSPILMCLEEDCSGEYIWPDAQGDHELLQCERCRSTLDESVLQFTRRSLLAKPPAILFTTTEMVNRQLGGAARRLLVGDNRGGPEYLLLDEVHTYSGTHGAQVGNLLRRWRSGFVSQPHIVGLSATLSDPEGFFAALTGLSSSKVVAVGPYASEMRPVGREYFLALRGDPASQTSLLSTTIQTAMLIRRMLDLTPGAPSGGAFGTKVFAFTDDLDVTNRLQSQLQDAEGWMPGGVNRKPQGSLATLRAATGQDLQQRDDAGQVWNYAEQFGTLQHVVKVGRTTSRDAGVDVVAEIVVATASLEVGFDDPRVGAVLQHKAPRDAAQFLQRRGRAGRDPIMRPWTVVVLSDFGRDRLAFQQYEALFEPVVQAAPLPVRNRVILKMQATWHLADQLERVMNLPAAAEEQRSLGPRLRARLNDLLSEAGVARISRQLRRSLGIDEEDARAVLWDHPRSLMSTVVPTLIRTAAALELGRATDLTPLREFVPSSLFAALQTPEVRLVLPQANANEEAEPVAAAMRQFAPGRVSYRYALNGRRDRLWVAPPPANQPLFDLAPATVQCFDLEAPPDSDGKRVIQISALRLETPPGRTSDSSYGRWKWRTSFAYDGEPLGLDVPAKSVWASVIAAFDACTHRYRCPLRVWRTSSEFEVERNDPQEPPQTSHHVRFGSDDVRVGFLLDVDGIQVRVNLPSQFSADDQLTRALRVTRLEFLTRNDADLADLVPSSFTRDWLHQVLLSTLITRSAGRSLQAALGGMSDTQLSDAMIDVTQHVFGSDPNNPLGAPGLVQDLSTTLQIAGVVARLRELASVLWASQDDSWRNWILQRYLNTIGAGMLQAIQALCPDVDTGSLRLDVGIDSVDDEVGVLRLTEDEPGGIGVIETFVDRYVEDPRAYWALVAASLGPSDAERVDGTLSALLAALQNGGFAHPVAEVRAAQSLDETTEAWNALRQALFTAGLPNDPSVTSALGTRFLRPGSTTDVDALATHLKEMWEEHEVTLGIEIELRVFAFVAAQNTDIQQRLRAVTQQPGLTTAVQIGQIVGLLWPRGSRLRAAALAPYSPYADHEPTERLLLAPLFAAPHAPIDMADADWRQQVDARLRETGAATLHVPNELLAAEAISDVLTDPTNVDVLELHPRVAGVGRDTTGLVLSLELREAYQ